MRRLEAPAGVQVWELELDTLPFVDCLTDDERARAARFRFERDRQRYRVCRSALRQLVGEALGQAPAQVRFTYGPQGKPTCDALAFNVSHSAELALIALGADGVDLEKVRHDIDPDALGRSVFTADERTAIVSVEDFFVAWTAKEALIKAEGSGFSSPLLQRTVWPELDPSLQEHFTLTRLSPKSGFMAALAQKRT